MATMTAIVVLHGRGEDRTHGMAHNFIEDLQQVLDNKSLNDKYKIVNIGLSDNCTEDYNWSSYKSMTFQLEKLSKYIKQDKVWQQLHDSSRIVLVGCSQGSLLLRGLLWDDCLDPFIGKIDKLITFGGPNNGIFGIPKVDINNAIIGPSSLNPFMYLMFRRFFSFADYWNSPSTSRRLNTYLAKINNENPNFLRGKYLSDKLQNGLVLISFENEEVVLPTISAAFGYWDRRGLNVMSYNETDLYISDRIGLKTLDLQNKITLYTINNRSHMSIPIDFVENKFFDFIS